MASHFPYLPPSPISIPHSQDSQRMTDYGSYSANLGLVSPGAASDNDPSSPVTPLQCYPLRPSNAYPRKPAVFHQSGAPMVSPSAPSSSAPRVHVQSSEEPTSYPHSHSTSATTTATQYAFDALLLSTRCNDAPFPKKEKHRELPQETDVTEFFDLIWSNENGEAIPDIGDAVEYFSPGYSFPPQAVQQQMFPMDVDLGAADVWSPMDMGATHPSTILGPAFSPTATSPSSIAYPHHPATAADHIPIVAPSPRRVPTGKERTPPPPKYKHRRPYARPSLVTALQGRKADPTTFDTDIFGEDPSSLNDAPVPLSPVIEHVEPRTPPIPSRLYSEDFPEGHFLESNFASAYLLQAQIGSGGFGFVMTALSNKNGDEVAVKFINKAKIPREHVVEDSVLGGLVPMEALILRLTNFPGIVKFIDFYQDNEYYYLVQELHGSPWHKAAKPMPETMHLLSAADVSAAFHPPSSSTSMMLFPPNAPSILPSASAFTFPSVPDLPITPEPSPPETTACGSASYFQFPPVNIPGASPCPTITPSLSVTGSPIPASASFVTHTFKFPATQPITPQRTSPAKLQPLPLLTPPEEANKRPNMARRPSHDLFECIEQHKKLGEAQARHIFYQVVQIVEYLDSMGISHRDIKDENLVVDSEFTVKLIDFGSAVVRDVTKPEPYYDKFFGTVTFAASEILRNQPYRARPAEIWTLGVLLSFLVTGESPFPDNEHAVAGRPVFSDLRKDGYATTLTPECIDLMNRCLHPDPDLRYTIGDIKQHIWMYMPLDP